MTHIVCRASSCLFWEQGVCTSEEIEYEPDVGCLTFQDMGDLELEEEDDEEFGWSEDDDGLFEDDDDSDDDNWVDEDDDWEDDDF
jgi:hypothetical protein